MKRLLLIMMVFGFINLSQAQTKEETIKWIKEKLEKYGGYDDLPYNDTYFTNIEVSPCNISYIVKNKKNIDESRKKIFNPSKSKVWVPDNDKVYLISDAYIVVDDKIGVSNLFTLRNGESNIHERMAKALLHLATFCEETKNEAF